MHRSGGRDLGSGARLLTGASLLAAGVAYAVTAADPVAGLVFSSLVLAGREFPLFRLFRGMNPTLASGLLALTGLYPILEFAVRRTVLGQPFAEYWHLGFAHLVMVLLVWRFHHRRLVTADHLLLLIGGLALVALGTRGEWSIRLVPLTALWAAPTFLAVSRVFVVSEEQRVLGLARVRGFLRDDAEEVAGREGVRTGAMYGLLLTIAFWAFAGGLFLTWSFPHVTAGVGAAWSYLVGEEVAPEEEGMGLPESEEEVPPFAIPPGVVGYLPFGARLERDEFNRRTVVEGVTLLARPAENSSSAGPDPLIRGECYDFLSAEGRWIRSRPRETHLPDISDGALDQGVTLPGAKSANGDRTFEYLVPPGPDRTLYALAVPTRVHLPGIDIDGTGNLLFAGRRAPTDPYVIRSTGRYDLRNVPVSDPGPEFYLLPSDMNTPALGTLVDEAAASGSTKLERIRLVAAWMRTKLIHMDSDDPVRLPEGESDAEVEKPPTNRFDVPGFLFDRKWGRNIDFATAYAMLLRADGIPCRLATGYRRGEWLRDAAFRVFRSDDLYAWVEVPFAGVGWVPFDPTPSVLEMKAEDLARLFSLPPEERAEEIEKIEEDEPNVIVRLLHRIDEFVTSLLPGDREESGLGRLVAWSVLLLAGSLFIYALVALVERGRRFVGSRTVRGGRPIVIPFYSDLLRILANRGMRRRVSETPLEFARKVIGALGSDFGEVGRLTNAFCSIRYGGAEVSRGDEAALQARVNALEDRLSARDAARREDLANRRQRGKSAARVLLLALLLLAPARPALASDPESEIGNLGSADADVRRAAREQLLILGRAAVPALVRALGSVEPEPVSEEVARHIRALDSDRFADREAATEALRRIGTPAIPALEEAAERGSPEVRRRANAILAELRIQARAEAENLANARLRRRRAVIGLLGELGGPAELEAVVQAGVSWPDLRRDAVNALVRIAPRAPEPFVALASRPDPTVRELALAALPLCRSEEVRPGLIRLLGSADPDVRQAALKGLVTAEVVEATDKARLHLLQARYDEAEALLREVLRKCPGYPEAGVVLARLLGDSGRSKEALDILRGLVLPPVDRALLVVPVMIEVGEVAAAIDLLDDLIRKNRSDPRLFLLAAEACLAEEPPRARLAMDRVQEGLTLAPSELELWFLSGRIRGEFFSDPGGARRDLFKALAIDSRNEDVQRELRKYVGK